jgi:hypothetical protein
MPTQQVQTVINGTNQSVNVSVMNLSQDLSLKDFVVIVGGSIIPNTSYTKTSTTSITYSGTPLTNENVILRRRTPAVQKHNVNYSRRISSNDWSDEIDRLYRRLEEVEAFGYNYLGGFIGAGNTVVNNQAYDTDWSTDTQGVSSRQAVYNKFQSVDAANQTNTNNITTVGSLLSGLSTTVNQQATSITNLGTLVTALQTSTTSLGSRVTTLENAINSRLVFTVRRTSSQTLLTNTPSTVVFSNEVHDPANWYNNTTGEFTVPANGAGTYEVSLSGNIGASSGLTNTYNQVTLFNVTDNITETIGYLIGLVPTAAAGSVVHQLQLLANRMYRIQVTTVGVSPTVVADTTRPMVFSLTRLSQ